MSDRKVGNNKDACKLYRAAGRRERNKNRNVTRAEDRRLAVAKRMLRRIRAGKPVPSHHLARVNGTSKGTCILLGADVTFSGCDSYASRHNLRCTSERVLVGATEDKPGTWMYKLVDVRRAA